MYSKTFNKGIAIEFLIELYSSETNVLRFLVSLKLKGLNSFFSLLIKVYVQACV
ncbi:MAG: hypothetical protein IKG36_01100 [Mycoplasmataceae bacterium]|nr:hypothetical protein [Mycoplasmataceae bacterium]